MAMTDVSNMVSSCHVRFTESVCENRFSHRNCNRKVNMRTLLFLSVLMTSCNSSTAAAPPLPHIAVTSEGGIAGRGVGGITIDDPNVSASDMRRTCTGALTEAE